MALPRKKKILIVEDETSLSRALELKLAHEGLKTFAALNGSDGLKLAFAEKPDLILLDIVMPRVDGIAMLRALRSDPWGKGAKVIVLTNLSASDQLSKAMDLGVQEYFVKSDWKIGDVVNRVKTALD